MLGWGGHRTALDHRGRRGSPPSMHYRNTRLPCPWPWHVISTLRSFGSTDHHCWWEASLKSTRWDMIDRTRLYLVPLSDDHHLCRRPPSTTSARRGGCVRWEVQCSRFASHVTVTAVSRDWWCTGLPDGKAGGGEGPRTCGSREGGVSGGARPAACPLPYSLRLNMLCNGQIGQDTCQHREAGQERGGVGL